MIVLIIGAGAWFISISSKKARENAGVIFIHGYRTTDSTIVDSLMAHALTFEENLHSEDWDSSWNEEYSYTIDAFIEPCELQLKELYKLLEANEPFDDPDSDDWEYWANEDWDNDDWVDAHTHPVSGEFVSYKEIDEEREMVESTIQFAKRVKKDFVSKKYREGSWRCGKEFPL